MNTKKNSKEQANLDFPQDLEEISNKQMKDLQSLSEEEINDKEKQDYFFHSVNRTKNSTDYKPQKRFEEILAEAMRSSKDGFEAISKALDEVSEQNLYRIQTLMERSERVNKIVLEELCALEMSYESLPSLLKQLNSYKKNKD